MDINNIISTLKTIEVSAHFWHLSTREDQHIAFGKLYSDINGLFDQFCETYQGRYNTLVTMPEELELISYNEAISYLKAFLSSFSSYVQNSLQSIPDLQNIGCEILELVSWTLNIVATPKLN